MKSVVRWSSLLLTIAWGMSAWGVEIQLRPQYVPTTPIVRLGNVADVYSDNPQEAAALAAIELAPSPPAAQAKFLRLREIQDLLASRGVNLAKIRFSGVAQVGIGQPGALAGGKADGLPASSASKLRLQDLKRAQDLVAEAAGRCLREHGQAGGLNVKSQLTDAQALAVLRAGRRLVVDAGNEPLQGARQLEIAGEGEQGVLRFKIDVEIEPAQMVVVAARVIPRGALIRPDDVQLAGCEVSAGSGDVVNSIDTVVGREVSKTIPAGRPVDTASLRSPLMIRRGEVVTVYARASGIRVKTVARAKQDASQGELAELESIPNRKTFLARVCGFQEAEVFAHAVDAASTAASGGKTSHR